MIIDIIIVPTVIVLTVLGLVKLKEIKCNKRVKSKIEDKDKICYNCKYIQWPNKYCDKVRSYVAKGDYCDCFTISDDYIHRSESLKLKEKFHYVKGCSKINREQHVCPNCIYSELTWDSFKNPTYNCTFYNTYTKSLDTCDMFIPYDI